jgi:ectoine hydroxylase-related dioxygenase (phytanoyl-CoA dioxygenase family)
VLTTTQQQTQFQDEGYTVLPSLVGGEALAGLRQAYDEILRGDVDCGTDDRQLGGITRQVMHPASHHEGIRKNPVWERAHEAASELLACDDAQFVFDMMIFKPAAHPRTTPWHQDLSYYQQPFTPAGVVSPAATTTFWVAMDDVDAENGCMHFVPGLHRGPLLPHHVFSGKPTDAGRLLAVMPEAEAGLDLGRAVACPLAAGGATVHTEGTPHFTPANTSADRARRAYITVWMDPARALVGRL